MSEWADRLSAAEGDEAAFEAALAAIRADRRITREALHRIAADYIGKPLKLGTKAQYLRQMQDHHQAACAAPSQGTHE